MNESMTIKRMIGPASMALIAAFTLAASAQTRVDPPKNSYNPADDVKLGREAAAHAEQQSPVLRDDHQLQVGAAERLQRRPRMTPLRRPANEGYAGARTQLQQRGE